MTSAASHVPVRYAPPRYASAMPAPLWFWETYGANHAVAELAWVKRVQLVRMCEAQNWRCCYCGALIDLAVVPSHPLPSDASREHVQPKSHGGGVEDDNIVAALRSL